MEGFATRQGEKKEIIRRPHTMVKLFSFLSGDNLIIDSTHYNNPIVHKKVNLLSILK